MRAGQRRIGKRDQKELHDRRRLAHPHERRLAPPRADKGHDGLRQSDCEGEDEGKVLDPVSTIMPRSLLFSLPDALLLQSVRHVSRPIALVVLGENIVGAKAASGAMTPSATTP